MPQCVIASPSLMLGAARACITPGPGAILSGFVARTEPMLGVHDDLFARALVLSDGHTNSAPVGVLALDLIGLDTGLVQAIRQRAADLMGFPDLSDRIAVTATHTHSGPAVILGARLGPVDEGYRDSLVQIGAETLAAAARELEPVQGWFGLGHESSVGKNRRVAGGPIDADVPVIRFDADGGRVRSVLVSYACHPVTLGPDNRLVSADYPGYLVRSLETVYGGARAMFLTGCCGQINTGHSAHASLSLGSASVRSFAEAERLGRVLAGAALQAAERAAPPGGSPLAVLGPGVAIGAARQEVDLPFLPVHSPAELRREAALWREQAVDLLRSGARGEARLLEVSAEWAEATAAMPHPQRGVRAEVMLLAVGELTLVFLPGEPFFELGQAIKQRAGRPIIVLGYANGSPGYVPHRSAYTEGGYEVVEAHRFYGQPAAFAPEAGEMLVGTALDLIHRVQAAD
ncbi:MAG: hypothetical protein JOY61_20350 [Chloroflexi bacterium]|nr:hypothetical protein [Chloroflexota bacterium]